MDSKNIDSNGGNVVERNSKSMQFYFSWELLKWAHKQCSKFFLEWDVFTARKTSLFLSFTSLIGMEWTKSSLIGMDLFNP
jgi:hypothetical protein